MAALPKVMTKAELHNLTLTHIQRYSRMVRDGEEGVRGIRLDECRLLLKTWQRIELVGGSLDSTYYSERETQEIRDAYADEFPFDTPGPWDVDVLKKGQ